MANIPLALQDIIVFIVALLASSGIGCLFVKYHIQHEARAAMAEDVGALHDKIHELEQRAATIEHDYVQCRFCDMQYKSMRTILESMDSKINILLNKQLS